ncbi:outer membrane beta-barrel family protein [Anditalea andensis]|uniref:Outer membrane protein beta-barrel domain-containing protein n=1 Tax=Anditalea andensis TaxID=1048983 RepID=A0A074L614_9BACT|nr:outer membrane beta-barrel family protein [Anditalea andensis]KEO75940.1 hypothetical protein EL17_00050 [Anditalea andensis]
MKNLKGKIFYLGCIIALFYATSAFQVKAQGLIIGRVMESETTGAAFATVSILNVSDSVMVKGAITDEEGNYAIRQVPGGNYLIAVSSVGFDKVFLDPIAYEGSHALTLPVIRLQEAALALGEVVVSAQRPVMERKSDRYVMDVTASSFQADNLMDIFRALPFVQVQGDGISVNGRAGILIVLDNVQMPGATMSAILENMTGDEVDNIEFITNPSSQYPADINSVIKITTKKSKNYGLTGSARSAISQGVRFRGNTGFSLLYRKNRWVADLNVNYSSDDIYETREGERFLQTNNAPVVISEERWASTIVNTLTLRGKLEYLVNDRHKFGIQSSVAHRIIPERSAQEERMGYSGRSGGMVDSLLVTEANRWGDNNVQNHSLYYAGTLDTLGKQVDLVLTYTPIRHLDVNQMQYQNLVSPEGTLLRRLPVVRNHGIRDVDIYVGQLDFALPFNNNWIFNVGSKVTLSTNKTRPFQEELQNGQFVINEAFSFINDFEENIFAGYGMFSKKIGKTTVNGGLRLEHATMLVEDRVNNTVPVNRVFTDLFPTLAFTRAMSENVQLTLNYRESIDRPGFSYLTPYRIYQNELTILEGNPALRPQYNRSITINSVIKNNLFLELEYKKEKDTFNHFPLMDGNTAIYTMRNFDVNYYSASLNYSFEITGWWSGSIFGMGAIYNSEMPQEEFRDLDIPQSIFHTIGITNTMSLPAGLSLDLAYNYTGPYNYGLLEMIPTQFTRVALKGSLFDKKLQYTLAAMDVFRTAFYGGNMNTVNAQLFLSQYADARRLQLGLVYQFGKKTVKNTQEQKLGNEDVINRAR